MVHDQRPDEGQGGSATMTDDSDARGPEGEGRQKAEEAVEKAKQQTEELKNRAKDSAGDLKHRAEQEVDRRSSAVAHRLESVVRALRTAADELEEEGQGFFARYARRGADQVDRAVGYLDEEDASSMLHGVEDMARRNPATFLGTSFATGLAVGRFLRSSQSHERDATDGSTTSDRDSGSRGQHHPSSWDEGDSAWSEENAPTWEGDAHTTAVTGASTTEVDSGMPVRDDDVVRDEKGGRDGTAD